MNPGCRVFHRKEKKHQKGVVAWGVTPRTNCGAKKKVDSARGQSWELQVLGLGFGGFSLGGPPVEERKTSLQGGWGLAVEWGGDVFILGERALCRKCKTFNMSKGSNLGLQRC